MGKSDDQVRLLQGNGSTNKNYVSDFPPKKVIQTNYFKFFFISTQSTFLIKKKFCNCLYRQESTAIENE